MFAGLVETLGTVITALPEPPGMRLVVDAGDVASDATIGASICVNGCCLSIVAMDGPLLTF
jgi:riboflavin synthase